MQNLFDSFVVCGVAPVACQASGHGDEGSLRMLPGIVDSMSAQGGRDVKLPSQFATVSVFGVTTMDGALDLLEQRCACCLSAVLHASWRGGGAA